MTPTFMRQVLANLEELSERFADDRFTFKRDGENDSAIDAVNSRRQVMSLIRRGRVMLTALETPSGPAERIAHAILELDALDNDAGCQPFPEECKICNAIDMLVVSLAQVSGGE